MKTCPDCGERMYSHGCTWCNEAAYIDEQERLTRLYSKPWIGTHVGEASPELKRALAEALETYNK